MWSLSLASCRGFHTSMTLSREFAAAYFRPAAYRSSARRFCPLQYTAVSACSLITPKRERKKKSLSSSKKKEEEEEPAPLLPCHPGVLLAAWDVMCSFPAELAANWSLTCPPPRYLPCSLKKKKKPAALQASLVPSASSETNLLLLF